MQTLRRNIAWLFLACPALSQAAESAPLPVAATREFPAVLLELGRNAPEPGKNPHLSVRAGALAGTKGTDSVAVEPEEVQWLHKGFGGFGGAFDFSLAGLAPGSYRLYARYKSGGEVAQAVQTFTLSAGAEPKSLGVRTTFTLSNSTPWQYQWLKSPATLSILPGDRLLRIENAGNADGAKIFDAFLLSLETTSKGISEAGARARSEFLQRVGTPETVKRRLYVLDGSGPGGDVLFGGLAADEARRAFDGLAVNYLAGAEAAAFAQRLHVRDLPAALLADGQYSLLGVLSRPKGTAQVVNFLADPVRAGVLPAIPVSPRAPDTPLMDGVPKAWLVGGLQDGLAGLSIQGLDAEAVLRPSPGQPYFVSRLMGGAMNAWREAPAAKDGTVVIENASDHSYAWAGGSSYAHLYLSAERETAAILHFSHSGKGAAAWLDGKPLPAESADRFSLNLSSGTHRLLVKFTTRQAQGERFSFHARFTDAGGKPLGGIRTRAEDPEADLALSAVAAHIRPLIYVDTPANLPHAGDPLRIRADLRWHAFGEEKSLDAPLPRFDGVLRLRIVDYAGKEIAVREARGLFPGEASIDFGKAPETGYYAVHASLRKPDEKIISIFPPDGFSVIGGNGPQRERLERKKLWNNNYYALADGDKSFREEGVYFGWLERMGVFRSYGGYPGFAPEHQAKWDEAKRRGIVIFGDSSGDSHWLNDKPEDTAPFAAKLAPYTRFLKASNEIDIRQEADWQALREPAHWVERARREYEAWHRARPDAQYVGGSLVRPGDTDGNGGFPGNLGPGRWFAEVLKLGLDRYQDAWDVHAYPLEPPRFGGPIGNGDKEDERGVLRAYAALGRTNTLPFWLGEAGAKAAYGTDGRRRQAEQAAKMLAWANSRTDYLGIAYCVAHEYGRAYGRLYDYAMGHQPGEAALYTAGALIDGLPYRAVETGDASVQAAYFGETFMIWRTDGQTSEWPLRLEPSQSWLKVNVVGQTEALTPGANGPVKLGISGSPVYVLPADVYSRLTSASAR